MERKVLIVDDERSIVDILKYNIEKDGTRVVCAYDGPDGLRLARSEDPDVILLDVMLPGMDGFEVCRTLRMEGNNVPIIMITAREGETDKVFGLDSGADDYITKPFSLAVLQARVNARLRRSTPGTETTLVLGPFSFDFEKMDFRRDGQAVELSKTEQKLLRVLVENRGRTVPRAALVDRVWTDAAEFVDENALSVTVKRLRSKLEPDPSRPEYLKTVYGIGYTWVVTL